MPGDEKEGAAEERFPKRWKMVDAAGRGAHAPRRILVVKLAGIGDLLTVTPCLRALRESFPSAHISVLVTPDSAPVLEGAPWVDDIIKFDKKLYDVPFRALGPRELAVAIGVDRTLRRALFDTVIVAHHLLTRWGVIKYALLALRSGAKVRVGLDDGRGWFYTHKVLDGGFGRLHEADYWLATANAIGARTKDRRLEICVSEAESSAAEQLLASGGDRPIIAVHPGSGGYSLARRWPVERYAEVADKLAEERGARILILGGPSEMDLAGEMSSMMRSPAIDLAGKTSLKVLAGVLRRCTLLVGNDSGVMHVAVAAGAPVLALFGPSNHRAWGPYFPDLLEHDGDRRPLERSIVVRSPRPCSPCLYPNPYRSSSRPCEDVSCMRDIQTEPVLEAAHRLLDVAERIRSRSSLVC